MVFVGPGWMNKAGRWEVPFELSVKSYEDCMAYYGKLKKEGKCADMTMAEYADYYRSKKTYTTPECALWKDILYGSDKQLFWYCDPFMRTCVDMNQGGALIDLRPYAAKINWPVGIGTRHVQDASYPFLVQSMYRAGYFTHYAGEGTIRSLKIRYQGEEADLCLCRTKAQFSQSGSTRSLTLDPVEIEFSGLKLTLQTVYGFEEGSSAIKTTRKILTMSKPAEVEFDEYITACYGTTEYPEDMTCVKLTVKGDEGEQVINYNYKCRDAAAAGAVCASAEVGAINTRVDFEPSGRAEAYIREGYAFSPMFTLGLKKKISEGGEFVSWLRLKKAK
jgi:hypothetical protein